MSNDNIIDLGSIDIDETETISSWYAKDSDVCSLQYNNITITVPKDDFYILSQFLVKCKERLEFILSEDIKDDKEDSKP